MTTFDKSIGTAARDLRCSSGATPLEVAEALDIPFEDYCSFEAGTKRLPPKQLVTLARLLHIPLQQLLVAKNDSQEDGGDPKSSEEARLVELFRTLDADGRRKCVEFAEKLSSDPLRKSV
jgi:hypothetical protein